MTCNLRPPDFWPLTPDLERRNQGICLWKRLEWGRRRWSQDGQIGRGKEKGGVVSGLIREGWKMDSILAEGWGQPGCHHVEGDTKDGQPFWRMVRETLPPLPPSCSFLSTFIMQIPQRIIFYEHQHQNPSSHHFFPKCVDKNIQTCIYGMYVCIITLTAGFQFIFNRMFFIHVSKLLM